MDYMYGIALGVLLYFGIMEEQKNYLEIIEVPEESKDVIIGISGICLIFLVFVIPIWYIQIKNIVKDTKKKRKDSDNVVKSSLLSNGEESDTMSMLVKPSSEWVPTSFVNITSLMHSSGGYTQKSCCCRKKKKKVFF